MDEKNIDIESPVELPKLMAQKLPEPAFEQAKVDEQVQAVALEQGQSTTPALPSGVPNAAQNASTTSNQTLPSTLSAASSVTSLPGAADDGDLIEKEWVVKAKAIVERTKGDPYIQNREMSKVKAEYIKRRYNKDLKLGDN